MKDPIGIHLDEATTPELIDTAIEERLAPGLAANRWRPDFAQFRQKRLWAEHHQKTMMRKLQAALGDLRGLRILDLGTGRGGLAVALARAGCRVVALDLRKRNLETTLLRARRYGLVTPVAVAVGERLPFADQSFDLVICKDMLEHCQDPSAVLAGIRRVLAPGGVSYLTVVNRLPFKDPHYHLWLVNFLPARLADRYIRWRGRGKESFRDRQELADMHYYMLPSFRRLARAQGLRVERDLHGLGRRSSALTPGARVRRTVGDATHWLGRRLSLGVESFELLVGPEEERGRNGNGNGNGTGARARRLALLLLPLLALLLLPLLLFPLLLLLLTFARAGATGLEPQDLYAGLRVEVRGKMRAERFSASRLTLKDEGGRNIEMKAPIEAILSSGEAPDPGPEAIGPEAPAAWFQLLGRPVLIPRAARASGAASLSELLAEAEAGRWIKIRGRDRGEWIAAESIVLRAEREGRAEIEGPIDRVKRRGNDRLVIEIGEFVIEVDGRTDLLADRAESPRLAPKAIDDDNIRPRAIQLLGGRVALGGQLRWDLDPESNLDLGRAPDNDRSASQLTGQVVMGARLDPRLIGFMKLGLNRVIGLNEPPGVDLDEGDFRLQEMYLHWGSPLRGVTVQVGRQDFDEPREWLYDENLDAIRLRLTPHRRTAIELSLAGHLGDDGVEGERGYGIAYGEVSLVGRSWVGAYLIGRNDPLVGDDARWLGLRAGGAPYRGFDPWLELGLLRGSAALDRDHRGDAIDFGATIQPARLLGLTEAVPPMPAITLGYARGSGDSDPADGDDRVYRQTGFDDNSARFAGVTSFKYYGELLDPELANIKILTMGAGVRVMEETSVDLVYHRYEQVVADDRVRSDLSVRPEGENPFLGSEVDLIVGFEEIENFEIELDLAAFFPGRAFAGRADTATRASLQFKLNF
jgi:ubiquinone/menaquinone biosynthesis C-methylase UbiE